MNSRLKFVRVWILVVFIYQAEIAIFDIIPEYGKYSKSVQNVVILQGAVSAFILLVVA